jgi:hypothetical protein
VVDSDSGSTTAPEYSTLRAYSGSQSIISQYDASHFNSGFRYSDGSELVEVYVTWRTYFEFADFDGQWKIWRLMPSSDYNDSSSPQSYSRATGDGVSGTAVVLLRPKVSTSSQLWRVEGEADDTTTHFFDYGTGWPGVDQWSRVEVYMKGSGQGSTDGSLILTNHRPDNGINTPSNVNYDGNLMIYDTDQTTRIDYFTFQNFVGNGTRSGNEKIFIDDIFIQQGSRARVEVGDASTWDACTDREVQIPSSWATGSITITVNQGTFGDTESCWLYIVDSSGNVNSSGFAITFGAAGGISFSGAGISMSGIKIGN